MARATGVGGIFFRAADPAKLHAWYEENLGIKRTEGGAFAFFSDGPREMTVFSFFPQDTKYFGSEKQQSMFNLRVDDIDAVVEKLRAGGAQIDPKREDHEYGRFAWFHDPEGNRVELWQPPSAQTE